ncbi:MAG: hypothetical protein N2V76_08425 [Methanophagales archaeon]|nr:hypothetical protein [Methanophagales archaeon]
MRNEEEIREMIKQIDECVDIKDSEKYDRLRSDKDFKYCLDIKAALQWVLRKISLGQERIRIEEEMKEILEQDIDNMEDDEFKEYIEFMDREFGRDYKNRDPYETCNVLDAFSWVLREESTENFISSAYMNLEGLRKKVKGEEPIYVEKTKEGKKQISSREIASEEREELLEIIDQMAKFKEKIHEIRVKRREIWDKQRVIRAKHMKDISMAKNEKEKPIYRNKDSREAELILRLKKDEEYQRLEEKYIELRGEENRLSIEYNRLVDRKAVLTGVFFEDEKIRVW